MEIIILGKIINTLFNTVSGKKITFLGWAFKKDTNDTRESASIYVAEILIEDGAEIHVYDPKVSREKIKMDMRNLWELKGIIEEVILRKLAQIIVYNEPSEAAKNSHAIAILTEWGEFKNYDWTSIYKEMYKPAFIFDGRGILDADKFKEIGFDFYSIGK